MARGGPDDAGCGDRAEFFLCKDKEKVNPFPDLFDIHINSGITKPLHVDPGLKWSLEKMFVSLANDLGSDPFADAYRTDVLSYYHDFMTVYALAIADEIAGLFKGGYPEYMVTVGIGANELFTRFAASVNNEDAGRRLDWFVINSPKDISSLPVEITTDNTLFLEFSRSGVAEETIKIHEYTPRDTKRIIFSNGGPLAKLAERDNNLVLPLPPEISGRFGRNRTPILLAPMFVAGMDTEKHWKEIDLAIRRSDICDEDSLPFVIAKLIFVSQKMQPRNLIYLGCNDSDLGLLGDQFIQFWNEGVNRPGNDIMMTRFFGLPRDSHMNIEGILGNHMTKLGIFLLRTNMRERKRHPLVSAVPDTPYSDHSGLSFGDEDVIFAMANYMRLSELMPTVLIGIPEKITMTHAAVLGQLFADVTFIYSRMIGVDPGSNPEVQSIRENSSRFLSSAAREIREKDVSIEKAAWELTR